MHAGIVQPSGPSSHFWISFGSVWARYTASGGAANRLVTTMGMSPSVLIVILEGVLLGIVLVVFCFYLFCVGPTPPGRRRGGHSFSRELFAAWQATGLLPRCRPWPTCGDAGFHPRGERSIRHLRGLSGVERFRVESSRTA